LIDYHKICILFFLFVSFTNVNDSVSGKNLKKNILFIVSDDLNCDIGVYGHKLVKTPNLDKLAKNGVVFENAHVQYPVCGPSRASFMTGLYPDQTKLKDLRMYLRSTLPDVVTLSEKYRYEGYYSVRIGKIFHADVPAHIGTSSYDDPFSWDFTFNPYGIDKMEESKINTLLPGQFGGTLSWYASKGNDEEQTDGISASIAMEMLEKFSINDENFFLGVGLFRPHTPYVAPSKYFDMYPINDIEVPEIPSEYLSQLPKPTINSIRAKSVDNDLDIETAKRVIRAYYASVTFLDAQVGRIMDKLKETGLDKNTIVVFTSDHGYHLGEHGHYQKQTLFDNATRVPLIFSGPDIIKRKNTIKSPVELVDIYPTLMDLTNHSIPEFISGKSLYPLLSGESNSIKKSAFTQFKNGYSIKTDRYRITIWGIKGSLGMELYDHKFDNKELNNLINNIEYNKIKDSLYIVLNDRIIESNRTPIGIKQIDGKKISLPYGTKKMHPFRNPLNN